VSYITKEKGSEDLTARQRIWIHATNASLDASVEVTSSTTQHIAHHMCTERVTTKNQLRVRAARCVGSDLRDTVRCTVRDLVTVILAAGEHDVFVVAIGKTGTDRTGQITHSSWIGLAIASCQKQMDIRTWRLALL